MFELVSNSEFESESETWIYYTFVFVFEFDFGVSPPSLQGGGGTLVPKKKPLPKKILPKGMESLGNCVAC